MALVTQQIEALTGGVSQAPASRRLAEQLQALVNGWPEKIRGLGKRPSSDHVAQLVTDETAYGAAFSHLINRDSNNRFRVILVNGDLKVFDEDGAAVAVTFATGKGYLTASTPKTAFRAVTAGDRTYIVNKTQTVAKSTSAADKSPQRVNEALVWIREVDFLTNYLCKITYGSIEYDANVVSGAGTTTDDRFKADTQVLATKMYEKMVGAGAGQAAMLAGGFEVTRYDSVIHIVRTDGNEFKIATGEGLQGEDGENVIKATWNPETWADALRSKQAVTGGVNIIAGVWDTVPRVEDLPPKASEGFRVQVIGDPNNEFDNYWYMYSHGSWIECVAPGEITALDASTMPHELLRSTLTYEDMMSINGPTIDVATATGGASEVEQTNFYDALGDTSDGGSPVTSLSTEGLAFADAYQYCYMNVDGADGVETDYVFTFDIDCRNLPADGTARVQVKVNDGTNSTNWGQAGSDGTAYFTKADGLVEDATIEFTDTLTQHWDFRIELNTQLDWQDDEHYAVLTPTDITFNALASNTPVTIDLNDASLDPIPIFPKGTTVTATVNGNPNVYTVGAVSGTDETAEAVATGLEVLIEDDTGITSSVSGSVITINHTTTTPTVACVTSYDSQKHIILDRDFGFTDDVLVGETIDNLTDGSSTTITANTGRTITATSALTGGDDNTYEAKDLCRIITGSSTFTLSKINWRRRAAGNETTNPWPSFVERKIQEVFFHAGRLGFAWGESIILSRAGEPHNFFRKTARQILDGDQIDVTYAGRGSAVIHSAIEMGGKCILFSELGQLLLAYTPILSPRTASLLPLTNYENSGLVRPIPYGSDTMFLQADGGACQVSSFKWNEEERPMADSLNPHAPTYIQGSPISWAISAQHEGVFVLTDDDQSVLYAGKIVQGRNNTDAAWCKWQFASGDTIIGIDVLDDVLGVIVSRDDGLFLEQINITENYQSTLYIDRKMDQADMTSREFVTAEKINQDMTYADGVDLYNLQWIAGSSAGFFTILGNMVKQKWGGSSVLSNGYCFKGTGADALETTGEYDISMEMRRNTSAYTNGIGLNFFMAEIANACTEYYQLQVYETDASTVTVKFTVQGDTANAEILTTTLAMAEGESLVFGITADLAAADAAKFEAWYEPVGGGTRTSLGLWANFSGGTWHSDGNHKKAGFSFSGSGSAAEDTWRWDNLIVTRTDTTDGTIITLPFNIPTGDTDMLLLKKADLSAYTYTRPTAATASVASSDLTAVDFWIGWPFDYSATLSEIFNRHWRTGRPQVGGHLMLRSALLEYADTVDATIGVAVTSPSGSYSYSVANSAASTGEKRVPIGTRSENAVITITSSTIYPLWLQALTWEGDWTERGRRL